MVVAERPDLDYCECRVELASVRAGRAALRLGHALSTQSVAPGGVATPSAPPPDPTALDRDIGMLRQRERALAAANPSLRALRLRAAFELSDLEDDVMWLVVSRHPALVLVEDPNAHGDVLSPSFAASALADTRRDRLRVHQCLARDGRLARTGLVRTRLSGERGAEVLRCPGFLPWWLAGQRVVSDEIAPLVTRVATPAGIGAVALASDLAAKARRLASVLAPRPGNTAHDQQQSAFVLVTGPRGAGKTVVAKALSAEQKRGALVLDCGLLAGYSILDQGVLLEVAFLESAVTGDVLILDRAELAFGEPPPDSHNEPRLGFARLEGLLQRLPALVVATAEASGALRSSLRDRALDALELPPIGRDTAYDLWSRNLGTRDPDVDLRDVTARFALTGRGIMNALDVVARSDQRGREVVDHACQAQQASGMSETTTRVWIRRERSDLELPDTLARQVDEIIRTETIREATLEQWGLAKRLKKGLGLVCLFDGDPGTGKTLAAEVIASALDMPLYTVNVANVVSKWIGETEKNLQKIFDDAGRNRCVVLFDEADSLFGKRTSVERSVDRFANMEINLLLQLVENHRGLVLLTTNLKDAIDQAFARRFAFKLSFEFPDAAVRERIWRRLLPPERLDATVDVKALAKAYELSGGSIRSIVLRAAYRAAGEGRRVDHATLAECATAECRALGRLVRER